MTPPRVIEKRVVYECVVPPHGGCPVAFADVAYELDKYRGHKIRVILEVERKRV